jgi:hypothetical protein
MTKGKAYILRQIRDLVETKRGYDEADAEDFVKKHLEDTVYQLLVLKKSLEGEDPVQSFEPPSVKWFRGEMRYSE